MVDVDGFPVEFVEDSSSCVRGLSLGCGIGVLCVLDSIRVLSMLNFSFVLCMNVLNWKFDSSAACSILELTSLEVWAMERAVKSGTQPVRFNPK